VDIRSQWKENWKSAQVVNFSPVDDPTIRQPGFNLPRQQRSLLYCFWTAQGHCGACKKKWNQAATDLCPCGEKQTTSHTVDSCPLTKFSGGLSQRHSADDEAVAWLALVRSQEEKGEHSHAEQGRSQEFATGGQAGSLEDGSPQRGPVVEIRWRAGSFWVKTAKMRVYEY